MYAYANDSFYPLSMRDIYEAAGSWPSVYAEVDDSIFAEFSLIPPEGKMRGTGDDGLPSWVDVPPPTQEELIGQAERQKQMLIDQANAFINTRQWPGKAVLGRLKGDDLTQYNSWLDYLDALEALDISSSPNFTWPTPPRLRA